MEKLITFDVWGTLILPDRERLVAEICKAIGEVLERHQSRIPLPRIIETFTEVDREVREIRLRELTLIPPEQAIKILLEKLTRGKPAMRLIDEVHDAICKTIEEGSAVRPAPRVYELLEKLINDGYSLVVVSNVVFWRSYATRRLLDKLGLSKYFTAEVYADVVKDVKPSPKMLKIAEREAGGQIIAHVGDSFSEDVAMALAYRVKAVFIDRRRQFLEESERSRVLLDGSLVIVSSLDMLLEDNVYKVITS